MAQPGHPHRWHWYVEDQPSFDLMFVALILTNGFSGTQVHISEGMGSAIGGAVNALAATSVTEVAITELDIRNAPSNDYLAAFRACTNQPKCVGVTVWGVSDRVSHQSPRFPSFCV